MGVVLALDLTIFFLDINTGKKAKSRRKRTLPKFISTFFDRGVCCVLISALCDELIYTLKNNTPR